MKYTLSSSLSPSSIQPADTTPRIKIARHPVRDKMPGLIDLD
jgi:hypothetical protein